MSRFSIIIPAYNASKHIRKTLDSIKQQTFKDCELIIVCDSCVDNTVEIAKEYTDKVFTVNFHHSGYTRNAGMEQVCGEYVLFMDDDDWYLHEFVLEILDKKLQETCNPDILFFSFLIKGHGYYYNPDYKHYAPAFWNKCWKREFMQDIRVEGLDAYMGDVEFQNKALENNPRVVVWDNPLYYYEYMRPGSMSDKKGF